MFYTTQNTTFISTGLCPEAISIVANPTPSYNIHVTHVIVSYYIHKMYNPALHNTRVVSSLLFSFVLFIIFFFADDGKAPV